MSAISNLPKNKKVLIGVAIALIIGAGGLYALSATQSKQTAKDADTSAAEKKVYQAADKKQEQNVKAVLGVILSVYRAQDKEFPEASTKGWNEVLDSVPITDSFTDPYSRTIYQYGEDNFDFGRIQYGPGMACKKDGTFTRGFGAESLALRAKFSDGYRCYNSFQG